MKKELKPKADYLFEISWEVCHQVGGIYTVIKSKAPFMKNIAKTTLYGCWFRQQEEK